MNIIVTRKELKEVEKEEEVIFLKVNDLGDNLFQVETESEYLITRLAKKLQEI